MTLIIRPLNNEDNIYCLTIFIAVIYCVLGSVWFSIFPLKGNKTLYEECEIDKQCDGTNISGVCKEIGHRKLCLCKNGYEKENNDLICRKGNNLKHVIYQLYYEDLQYLIDKFKEHCDWN